MTDRYVLIDHVVRRAEPAAYEAFWARENPGRVGLDVVNDIEVSTVFLTRPVGNDASGAPLLFETALFGPSGHIGVLRRYSSWDDARLGHRATVDALRQPRVS